MPIQFIDLIDDTGRTSALSLNDQWPNSIQTLKVVGGLSHGLKFQPRTKADSRMLIKWLQDNMHTRPERKLTP